MLALGRPTEAWAMSAASKDVIAPLLLTSAAICWFGVSVISPTTYCATSAASKEVMPSTSGDLDGVTVYGPLPSPLNKYAPLLTVVALALGVPAAESVTPGTGFAGPEAVP